MLIALVTWRGLPEGTPDEQLVALALEARGAEARHVAWDDPGVDWTSFDAVVLRSCWDYHKRVDEFRAWLDRLPPRVFNPVEVVRWNMDKRYLRGLPVPVVPTEVVPRGEPLQRWPRTVAKPLVSASAWRTHVVEDGEVTEEDMIVQPFVEEIADGEWSLIFFRDQFSHAVLKRPQVGDFRVQQELGGSADPAMPEPAIIEQAANVLRLRPGMLYARVDGVVIEGVFTLMELELIEPSLFLTQSSAETFAEAIVGVSPRA